MVGAGVVLFGNLAASGTWGREVFRVGRTQAVKPSGGFLTLSKQTSHRLCTPLAVLAVEEFPGDTPGMNPELPICLADCLVPGRDQGFQFC